MDPATGAGTAFASGISRFGVDLERAADGSLYYLGRGVTGVETGLWRIAFRVDRRLAMALAPRAG